MIRIIFVVFGSGTSINGSHTKFIGSLTWYLAVLYFAVLSSVQLILFSAEETLLKVTSLPDDLYGHTITDLIDVPTRPTRGTSQQCMASESVVSKATEGGVQPIPPAPQTSYVGSDFCDYSCLAVGLRDRDQLRRVEDYLADNGQMLLPVSFGSPAVF